MVIFSIVVCEVYFRKDLFINIINNVGKHLQDRLEVLEVQAAQVVMEILEEQEEQEVAVEE